MPCIFCDLISRQAESVLWSNGRFSIILDTKPINPGHVLVVPNRHEPELFSLSDEEYADLFGLIKKISPILKDSSSARRIGVAVEGFGVPHTHIHLVPVNAGNELNPTRAKELTREEALFWERKLKEAFSNLR